MTVRTTSTSDDWADLYRPPADHESEAVLGLGAEGKGRSAVPTVEAGEPAAAPRSASKAPTSVAPPAEEAPHPAAESPPTAPAQGSVSDGGSPPPEARRLTPQPMPAGMHRHTSLPLRPRAASPATGETRSRTANPDERRTPTSPATGEQVRRGTGSGRTLSPATGDQARRLQAVADAARSFGSHRRNTTSMLRKARPSVPQPDADGVVNLLLDHALKVNVPVEEIQKLHLSTIEAYILWQLDGHRTIGETYQMMSHMDANDVRDVLLKLLDLGLVLPV